MSGLTALLVRKCKTHYGRVLAGELFAGRVPETGGDSSRDAFFTFEER